MSVLTKIAWKIVYLLCWKLSSKNNECIFMKIFCYTRIKNAVTLPPFLSQFGELLFVLDFFSCIVKLGIVECCNNNCFRKCLFLYAESLQKNNECIFFRKKRSYTFIKLILKMLWVNLHLFYLEQKHYTLMSGSFFT